MRAPDHRQLSPSTPLFLAGPPTSGAVWREAIARLGCGEARSVVEQSAPAWSAAAERLSAEADFRERVVVAHGLAVPVAVGAALRTPPRILILSNGPLRRLDPVTRLLAGLAGSPAGVLLERVAFQPRLALPALASSAALRRAVVNPYVMDRDTVALLCGPLVDSAGGRHALRLFFKSLGTGLPDVQLLTCPVFLVWGDADPLNPASEADWLDARRGGGRRVDIAGGRFLHPEERPWAIADAVAEIMEREGLGRPGLTQMSRSADPGQFETIRFDRSEEL